MRAPRAFRRYPALQATGGNETRPGRRHRIRPARARGTRSRRETRSRGGPSRATDSERPPRPTRRPSSAIQTSRGQPRYWRAPFRASGRETGGDRGAWERSWQARDEGSVACRASGTDSSARTSSTLAHLSRPIHCINQATRGDGFSPSEASVDRASGYAEAHHRSALVEVRVVVVLTPVAANEVRDFARPA